MPALRERSSRCCHPERSEGSLFRRPDPVVSGLFVQCWQPCRRARLQACVTSQKKCRRAPARDPDHPMVRWPDLPHPL